MSAVTVDCAVRADAELGEGACWDARAKCLWWVDIRGGRLHCYTPATGMAQCWAVPDMVTCVAVVPGTPGLIGTSRDSIVRLVPTSDGALDIVALATPHDEPSGNRFNDGKLAPDGTLWAGTMDDSERACSGRWLRYDPAGQTLREIAGGFKVTNGPAFDPTANAVYLTDSAIGRIYRATLDPERGCTDMVAWRDFDASEGYPDGMTFAPDGTLWVAFWDGSCVRQLDSSGTVLRELRLPVLRPTSIAFASPTLAFVTSARPAAGASELDGSLLRLDFGGTDSAVPEPAE